MLSLHRMKTSSQGSAGGIVNYLFEKDTVNYYSEQNQVVATWYGKGCEDFGLKPGGAVDQGQLRALLEGQLKDGSDMPGKRPATDHSPGLDMTFSSVKGLSIIRAWAGEEQRAAVDDIIYRARCKALDYADRQGFFEYRTGAKGAGDKQEARPVFALFSHHTSREVEGEDPDMQEHYHVVALNACKDETGYHRMTFDKIFKHRDEIGAIMRCEEAAALKAAGYTIEREGAFFRVCGVPKEAEQYYSKRRLAIIQKVGEDASVKSKAVAAQDGRIVKDLTESSPEKHDARWVFERATKFGLGVKDIADLNLKEQKLSNEAAKPRFDITAVIDKISLQKPYFREIDFRKEVAIACQGIYAGETIDAIMDKALRSKRLVKVHAGADVAEQAEPWMVKSGGADGLSVKDAEAAEASYARWAAENPQAASKYDYDEYVGYVQDKWNEERLKTSIESHLGPVIGYTTRETIQADEKIRKFMATALAESKHALDLESVQIAVREFEASRRLKDRDFLISEQQMRAIAHCTTEHDIALVEGVAGAGKTTFLYPVARAYEAAGYTVFAITFKNKMTADLRTDLDLKPENVMTIDSFLTQSDGEKLALSEKSVVLIDEAGEVGGLKFSQIFERLQKAGAKGVATGHTRQTQAITGTAAFKLALDMAGPERSANIRETKRQRDVAYGKALTALSEGKAEDALVMHAMAGRLQVVDGEGFEEAAILYHQSIERVGADKAFVLTDTNAAMRQCNNIIRENLKKAGVLAERDFLATLSDARGLNEYETRLSVGERIITRGRSTDNQALQTGILWRINDIEEVEPGHLKLGVVRADGRGSRQVIDTQKYDQLHPSYAMTSSLSQGMSVEEVSGLITSPSGAELSKFYVTLSRAREMGNIIVSKYALSDLAEIQGKELKTLDPEETAAILKEAVEDESNLKKHTGDLVLDPSYKHEAIASEEAFKKLLSRENARMGESFVHADLAKVEREERRKTVAAKTPRAERHKDQAPATVHNGRLKKGEQGHVLSLDDMARVSKDAVERQRMAQALGHVGTTLDPHTLRKAQAAALKNVTRAEEKCREATPENTIRLTAAREQARKTYGEMLPEGEEKEKFFKRCNTLDRAETEITAKRAKGQQPSQVSDGVSVNREVQAMEEMQAREAARRAAEEEARRERGGISR
ncbi:MAG: hypothetical protein B7Z71_00455 [Acidocella sp. 21-58-7]|nr:MAG: hypothetical protein B7Z71_00455 [Acidocella sp. 21-58-7]HQT65838.1 MobF family relaxase [Acidocella sp.]